MKKLTREIGSEFWNMELTEISGLNTEFPHQFLLTGRTALDFIINDIKSGADFTTVYLPSYCCHTMIQPFIENGIAVLFYEVSFSENQFHYNIDFNAAFDAVLIMQYFGYHNIFKEQLIERFRRNKKLIIEDATHSWFSSVPYNPLSDYVFTSFRKWTGLACGALVLKQNSEPFHYTVELSINKTYIELRRKAAELKQQFIEEGLGKKEVFLNYFNMAEEMLDRDYRNYGLPLTYIDCIRRLDLDKIRTSRIKNAAYLTERLKKFSDIETIELTDRDVPLFVPVFIRNGTRDELRRFLIQKDIYSPVHWPLSNQHGINNIQLYNSGMSLVCDQRYTERDMERIIQSISEFYGGRP